MPGDVKQYLATSSAMNSLMLNKACWQVSAIVCGVSVRWKDEAEPQFELFNLTQTSPAFADFNTNRIQ